MKTWLVGMLMLLSPSAFAQQQPPEIPFDVGPEFPRSCRPTCIWAKPPASPSIPRATSSSTAAQAAAARAPHSPIPPRKSSKFDRDGTYLREIGKGLYAWAFAHTVRIDKDDNIWATDKGSDMIVKFNPEGRVQMVFGRKQEASEKTEPHERVNPPKPFEEGRFRQPTDVTWDSDGNIYISDGYVNARVAKLSKDGDWIKSWGKHGNGPGEFNLLHSIASDAQNNIYVGDRNNRRIQVFDTDGNFKREIRIDVPPPADAHTAIGNKPNLTDYLKTGGTQTPGAPWALCITPPPNQVLYSADSFPGRIYKLSLDGKVLGNARKVGQAAQAVRLDP